MPLSKKFESGLNNHIMAEFGVAYGLFAMSTWLGSQKLDRSASWMRMESDAARGRADTVVKFTLDRGGGVVFGNMWAPPYEFESPLALFEHALTSLQHVSAGFDGLYATAQLDQDIAGLSLLAKLADEHVAREAAIEQVVADLKRASGSDPGLLIIDRGLGELVSSKAIDPHGVL